MSTTTSKKSIKTRILVLSDTHTALPRSADSETQIPFKAPLPAADILIHCGDLTQNGSIDQHQKALDLINSVQAELKIVIPGNHDLTLDRAYYDRYPNEHCDWTKYSDNVLREIKEMYEGEEARGRGIRYLEEGTAAFRLKNGARLNIYASAWQPEFCNWGFSYPRSVDRFNPQETGSGPENPVPDFNADGDGIDIMVTHGPPKEILDRTMSGDYVGCEHLLKAVQRCRPKLHCFGHIHEGWGAMVKQWDFNEEDISASTTVAAQPAISASIERPATPPHDNDTSGSKPAAKGETLRSLPSYEEQVEKRGVFVDATPLRFGRETLFVNASIMNVMYQPLYAPWVVDVELFHGEV